MLGTAAGTLQDVEAESTKKDIGQNGRPLPTDGELQVMCRKQGIVTSVTIKRLNGLVSWWERLMIGR